MLGLLSLGLHEAFTGLLAGHQRSVGVSRPAAAVDAGTTELMLAAHTGNVASIKELVGKGADVNSQDAYGWTALRYAVRSNNLGVVESLIAHGADVNLASYSGRTPLMSAIGNDFEQIVELLVKKGADLKMTDEDGLTAYDHAFRGGSTRSNEVRELVRPFEKPPEVRVDLG